MWLYSHLILNSLKCAENHVFQVLVNEMHPNRLNDVHRFYLKLKFPLKKTMFRIFRAIIYIFKMVHTLYSGKFRCSKNSQTCSQLQYKHSGT